MRSLQRATEEHADFQEVFLRTDKEVAGLAREHDRLVRGVNPLFLVGIPTVLVASAIAGGVRSPTKIPLRDAILYVGISVAIVVGILVYAMYHH